MAQARCYRSGSAATVPSNRRRALLEPVSKVLDRGCRHRTQEGPASFGAFPRLAQKKNPDAPAVTRVLPKIISGHNGGMIFHPRNARTERKGGSPCPTSAAALSTFVNAGAECILRRLPRNWRRVARAPSPPFGDQKSVKAPPENARAFFHSGCKCVARARRAAWRREARLSFSFPLVRDDAGGFGNAHLADKRAASWGRDHDAVARRRFAAEPACLLRRLALHCCALR